MRQQQQQQAQPAACALLVKRSAGAPESTRAQRSTNGVWAVLVGSFHCAPQAALGCRTLCRSVSRLGLSAGTACTGVLGVLTRATSIRRMLASAFPHGTACGAVYAAAHSHSGVQEQARRAEYLPALPADGAARPTHARPLMHSASRAGISIGRIAVGAVSPKSAAHAAAAHRRMRTFRGTLRWFGLALWCSHVP